MILVLNIKRKKLTFPKPRFEINSGFFIISSTVIIAQTINNVETLVF